MFSCLCSKKLCWRTSRQRRVICMRSWRSSVMHWIKRRKTDSSEWRSSSLCARTTCRNIILVVKFTKEAMTVYGKAITYIQKWFSFDQSPYRPFKCLALGNVEHAPSIEDIVDVWMVTPWKSESSPDALHDKVTALSQVFSTLQGSMGEKLHSFFGRN